MTLKDLREKRANIYEMQKDIHSKAKEENRSMNDEENKQWDAYEKDYGKLTLQIQEGEVMAAKEAEDARTKPDVELSKAQKKVLSEDPKEREEQREKAFGKYIRCLDKAEDRQLLKQFEQRVQTVGTTTEGGFLVPEGYSNKLDIQRALWGGMRAASTVWKTASGQQIPYPTIDDTSNTADTEAESADLAASEDDLVFAEKTFNAYKLSSNLLKVSNELMNDSYFDMEALMYDMFGERIGRKENALFTTGSGSSTPQGIATAAQQSKRIASTSTVTRAELVDLVHSVNPAYRNKAVAGFMFNDTTLGVIKKVDIGSSDSRPLWAQSMRDGEPDRIDGYQYWINQDVASFAASAKAIYFGDFSKFVIRDSGPTRVIRLNERFADTDQTGFVTLVRVDSELLVNSAIKYLIAATS